MPFLGCWFCLSALGSSAFSLTSVLAAVLLHLFSLYLSLGMLGWTCCLHPQGTALGEGDLGEVVWESFPLPSQVGAGEPLLWGGQPPTLMCSPASSGSLWPTVGSVLAAT